MVDIRQSENYAQYLKSQGWTVERINNINYFIRRFPLIGSVLKVQRPRKIDFEAIERLSKKYRSFQIIIEPDLGSSSTAHNQLYSHGFRLNKNPYLPTKTIQIDLTQSKEAIFKSFKKHTRQAIKKGEGLVVKEYSTPNEIKIWHKAFKKSVNFNRFVPSLDSLLNIKKSFPQRHSLFLASHNIVSRIIGGALFTASSHGGTNYIAYYWYGFTNKEGRTSLSQYSLLYQGILWAKKSGYKVFDMEGIYDERFPNKSWLGFTRFKKSFGGKDTPYLTSFKKFRLPV